MPPPLPDSTVATSPWVYVAFTGVVLILLALDLGVFHRRAHTPRMREAVGWTAFWVALALLFAGAVYFLYEHRAFGLGAAVPVVGSPGQTMSLSGGEATKLYITAYLVEKSLSMDNVFVIAMIFTSLAIPPAYQHRVLFWGILGALMMRGLMIGLGAAVVARFSWIVYVFGALLIGSALKMALAKEGVGDPSRSFPVRLIRFFVPVSTELDGQRLLTRVEGRLHATPLLVALVVIEATDVLFAVDSIPAVFAITGDPFIVFTSNIMAILGLRSLYFCLASAMMHFRFLKAALIAVLLFVGIKMCLVHTDWKVPAEISLAVILGLLASGITASIVLRERSVETPPDEGILRDEPEPEPRRLLLQVWRSNRTLRRLVVLTAGSLTLLAAVIIAPLPGPGMTILGPLGVGILASEFIWARRLALGALRRERAVRAAIDRTLVRFSRLYIIPVTAGFWAAAWLFSRHADLPQWVIWSLVVPVLTPLMYIFYRWHRARTLHRRGGGH